MGKMAVYKDLATGEDEFGIPDRAWARCKIVSPDYAGLGDPYYDKVQDALNACPLNLGYTVIVLPGAYSEELDMGSGVNLHLLSGAVVSATGAGIVLKAIALANEVVISGKGVFSSTQPVLISNSTVSLQALRLESTLDIKTGAFVDIDVDELRFDVVLSGNANGKIETSKCGNITSDATFTGKMFFKVEEIAGTVSSNAGEVIIDFQEMLGAVSANNGSLVMRNGHINRGSDTLYVVLYGDGDLTFEDVRIKHLSLTGDAIRYSSTADGSRVVLKHCVLISAQKSVNKPSGVGNVTNYGSVSNVATNNITVLVDPMTIDPNVR